MFYIKTDKMSCFMDWYKFGTLDSKCIIKKKEYYVLHN